MSLKNVFKTFALLVLFLGFNVKAEDSRQSLEDCIKAHTLSKAGCEDDTVMQGLGLSNELEKLSVDKECAHNKDLCQAKLKILENKFDTLLPSLKELASSDYTPAVPLHVENSVRIMSAIQEKLNNQLRN